MSSVILFIIVEHFNVFTTKAFQMITLNIKFQIKLKQYDIIYLSCINPQLSVPY